MERLQRQIELLQERLANEQKLREMQEEDAAEQHTEVPALPHPRPAARAVARSPIRDRPPSPPPAARS